MATDGKIIVGRKVPEPAVWNSRIGIKSQMRTIYAILGLSAIFSVVFIFFAIERNRAKSFKRHLILS